MKHDLDMKMINKSILFDNSLFNNQIKIKGAKNNKNSILKSNIKSMDKRYNIHSNNNIFKPKIYDRIMYTRQNSNQLMETLNINHRNFSNKKMVLSNSYKKREKIIKTNDIISNKIKNNNNGNIKSDYKINKNKDLKHKKILSLPTYINNNQINNKKSKNSSIFKPNLNNNKLKDYYSLIKREKIDKLGKKNVNSSNYNNIFNNTFLNKNNLFDSKVFNKSFEHRKKISKIQMQIKNQNNHKKPEIKEKTENIINPNYYYLIIYFL